MSSRFAAPPPLPFGGSLELPAGGVDVAAAGRTHGRRDSGLEHNIAERPDPLVSRAFVRSAWPGVEWDEVDLRRQFVPADQPNQFARMLVAVVLVLEHYIFECDA